ncbi:WD repeat-containing protein 89-like isoform 2-T4 [Cochliomyia hominivorax]
MTKNTEDGETSKHSEENTNDFEDDDTCSASYLEEVFKHKYKIHDEPAVAFDNSYVLSLTKDDAFTCIAAGLSDGSVRLFEINSERGLYIQPPMSNKFKESLTICGVRFVDETPNLLLVGTTNGLVRLLDLRTRNEVSRFKNIPANKLEPRDILAFDRNSNSRLLCMGTVQRGNNVNLLFYDLRTSNKLFTYFESHQDDVTSLRFHPQNPDILCSGSTDGLINIFDVSASDEDNAILTTINTESTVHKINWHKNTDNKDIISCVTNTSDFKLYEYDGDIIAEFDRLQITETIKRKNEANCNLIDCYSTIDNGLFLLTGSNLNEGETLRSCTIKNGELKPYANFVGNKQIVRESIFDAKTNILITAGESGFVTLWTPLEWQTTASNSTEMANSSSGSLVMKSKKSHKYTPY